MPKSVVTKKSERKPYPVRVIIPPVTHKNKAPPFDPVNLRIAEGFEKMPVPIILLMISAAVDKYPN